MAKILIAGAADCPYYAKVELLADALVKNIPDFKLHKVIIQPDKWTSWLEKTCAEQGWTHTRSPIIWRELVDRGGKGMLIGGANEFQEYAKGYYYVESSFTSEDMRLIAAENLKTKTEVDGELAALLAQSQPTKVCLTCAAGPTAYSMISPIVLGHALGEKTEISLVFYDSEEHAETLSGVEMEAFDLASSLLHDVTVTSNIHQALSDCQVVIFLDELLQEDGEPRETWLKRNYDLFTEYAKVLNEVGDSKTRVIVAGNGPVNFNAWVLLKTAHNIPRPNVVALSRMVENHAKSILAERLKVNSAGLVDIVVWGNINGTNVVDVDNGRVHGYDGAIWGPPSFSLPVADMVHDNKWLSIDFVDMVKKKREKLMNQLNKIPSSSSAAALTSFLSHWWHGSPEGQIFSLGVYSEGCYNLPEDIVFSLPVKLLPGGGWEVVESLTLSDELQQNLQTIAKELQDEQLAPFAPPKQPTPPPTVESPILEEKEEVTEAVTTPTPEAVSKTEEEETSGEQTGETTADEETTEQEQEAEPETEPEPEQEAEAEAAEAADDA